MSPPKEKAARTSGWQQATQAIEAIPAHKKDQSVKSLWMWALPGIVLVVVGEVFEFHVLLWLGVGLTLVAAHRVSREAVDGSVKALGQLLPFGRKS